MTARLATRTDAASGIEERVGFVGADGRRVFAALALPAGPPDAVVVVCPSILIDIENTDRREVELCRALARAGVAAARFHPRGAGHSDDVDAFGLASIRDDAEVVLDTIREVVPDAPLRLVGVRVGALVAADLAAGGDVPLALWEPATDVRSFLREGFRATRMRHLAGGATAEELAAGRPALERLAAGEEVALAGYPVPPALLRGTTTLADAVAAGRGPLLVVQLGPRPHLAPALRGVVEQATVAGRPVRVEVLEHPEGWWYTAGEPAHEDLAGVTVPWLAAPTDLGAHQAPA